MKTENKNLFGFSFAQQKVDKKKKVESKIYSKLTKHRARYAQKIEDDIALIKEWVQKIGPDEQLQIVSNVIDCPNILEAYLPHITEAYIATWSITPAGVSAIEQLANSPILENAILLIDKTHSYKWIFASGAYEIFKKKIKIKCAANHTKFIVVRLDDGTCLNFVGSMNMSNNPRYENMAITKSVEDFEFYKSFMVELNAEQLKYGEKTA